MSNFVSRYIEILMKNKNYQRQDHSYQQTPSCSTQKWPKMKLSKAIIYCTFWQPEKKNLHLNQTTDFSVQNVQCL